MIEDERERALAAEVAIAALDADALAELDQIARALAEESGALPPLSTVHDLARVLTTAALPGLRVGPAEPLRSAVRRWDDHVLARLALDPRAIPLADAIAALPRASRAPAIALVIAQLLARAPGVGTADPGAARRVLRRPPGELAEVEVAAHAHAIAERLDALTRRLRALPALLTDADLVLARHAPSLRGLARRVALAQVVDAAEELSRALPRRLRRLRERHGATATRLEDESAYPIGGFSSMSTQGTLENLVTSELGIMEPEGSELRRALGFDLFDLRWAQGELLYYVRDESVAVRERRAVILALDPALAAERVKDPGLPWQRLVIALGIVQVAIERFCELLGEHELAIHVVVPDALRDEREILEIALRDPIERGAVEIDGGDPGAIAEREAERGDVVWIGIGGEPHGAPPHVHRGALVVGARASMRWSARDTDRDEPAWDSWARAARSMIEGAC